MQEKGKRLSNGKKHDIGARGDETQTSTRRAAACRETGGARKTRKDGEVLGMVVISRMTKEVIFL